MILNARVARLNQHAGDASFDSVMGDLEAAQAEGLADFELDVSRLDRDTAVSIAAALGAMEYNVDYNEDEALLYVSCY